MRQIRKNVFETNSSSTHSITICSKEDYDKWINGEVLYSDWNNDFIEAEALTPDDYDEAGAHYESNKLKYYKGWKELSENEQKEYTTKYVQKRRSKKSYSDYRTYDEWCKQNDCLTKFETSYTTKNGDKIVAFGAYGYDG